MHLIANSACRWPALDWRVFAAVVLALALVPHCANAQSDVAVFSKPGERLPLAPYVRYITDDAGVLSTAEAAERLKSAPIYDGHHDWLELGMKKAVVWIAISLRNETDLHDFVLEFRNPRMSYVDFYFPDGQGGWVETKNGVMQPFSERPYSFPMPAFPILLNPGEAATVLLRLENNGDFRQRVWFWDAKAFTNHAATAYVEDIMTVGMLAVLVIYQFLVFLSLREKSYLYLFLFALSWMLFLMAATGLGKMLLWQDLPWLTLRANSVFGLLMGMSFLAFAMEFLESRKHTPYLYRFGMAALGICFVHLIYSSFTDSLLRIEINRYVMLGAMMAAILLAIQAVRKGNRGARFFVATWIFLILGGLVLLAMSWYVVPSRFLISTPVVSILFTSSILLWTLELIGRVKVRAREQQALLEAQVKERTHELETALSEVKTLSGLLPICSSCKKIRDDSGYWNSVEQYFSRHMDAGFTHGICPDCYDHLYPELIERRRLRELRAEGGDST